MSEALDRGTVDWAHVPVEMQIDAALQSPLSSTHLIRYSFAAPVDKVLFDACSHWFDLSLTPRRNARASFREHARGFEPLGDLYVVPAGHAMHGRGDTGSYTALVCQIHSRPERLAWNSQLQACANVRSASIRGLLLRLGEEARQPGFASEAMADAIADQLLIELVRHSAQPRAARGLSAPRLRRIDERIRDQRAAPTLAELAELCDLSVRQLTRSFREARGCSVGDYIARSRIDMAKQLLAGTESVKSIAHTMGFSSTAAFCEAFRRATAETPGAYRRRVD